jgi:hypothetical protein
MCPFDAMQRVEALIVQYFLSSPRSYNPNLHQSKLGQPVPSPGEIEQNRVLPHRFVYSTRHNKAPVTPNLQPVTSKQSHLSGLLARILLSILKLMFEMGPVRGLAAGQLGVFNSLPPVAGPHTDILPHPLHDCIQDSIYLRKESVSLDR